VVVSVRWIEDEVTADDEHSLHCADRQLPLARRTRTGLANLLHRQEQVPVQAEEVVISQCL
jgi:hypothetical protein